MQINQHNVDVAASHELHTLVQRQVTEAATMCMCVQHHHRHDKHHHYHH